MVLPQLPQRLMLFDLLLFVLHLKVFVELKSMIESFLKVLYFVVQFINQTPGGLVIGAVD